APPPPVTDRPPVLVVVANRATAALVPYTALFRSILLEVVSEKTGYPAGMLDLGMALDADLGVDSIKRVEILSAFQDRLPTAPAVKPGHLGSPPTLHHAPVLPSACKASVTTPPRTA